MSSITVELSDYLSEDDMRQIAREQFADVCRKKSQEDFQRILDNAAYDIVQREVDAVFDGKMAESIKAKAVAVIGKLDNFLVFRRPDVWDRGGSKGWEHLQAAIEGAAPLLRERVDEVVRNLPEDTMRELIEGQVASAIIAKLTGEPK